jgi:hypothetical protein
VSIIVGGVFVGLGVAKSNQLSEAMRTEEVRLPLHPEEEDAQPVLIDTAAEAQAAGDIIREHRREIAPSYQALLGEGRFDPTNPEHLIYTQALNMENYLYLAVIGFGLTQAVLGTGVFMVITGIALGSTGFLLYRLR